MKIFMIIISILIFIIFILLIKLIKIKNRNNIEQGLYEYKCSHKVKYHERA
jgi:heme/copper-type cytochrome/quinol oxidase subunit 2